MARTKTKARSASSSVKTAERSELATADFAEAEDFPEAQTVAELKKAAATSGKTSATKKTTKQKAKEPDAWSVAERLRFKWGMGGVKTLSFLIRLVLFAVLVIVVWTLALTIASGVVPTVAQLVSDGTGVTFESRLDQIVMGLLLPTLFLNGLLFVLVCVSVKKLWNLHIRLGNKARNVLLGASA